MSHFTSAGPEDAIDAASLDDLEDLLGQLAEEEVQSLLDEMASDPDDVHLPASVRNSYRCNKTSTGDLNRDSLINHINEEGKKDDGKPDIVPFELGKKRGKVYIPNYNEEERAAMARAAEVADAVRLDDDEEAALGVATTNDLMSLAEILDSNPQEFIMEAYADKLKFFEPDENVKVNLEELIAKVKSNDKDLKELILTNTKDIKEEQFEELFRGFANNDNLLHFSAANCGITDQSCAVLNNSLKNNQKLQSLNLDTNSISPDTLGDMFDALTNGSNITVLHLSNQSQINMGYRVECRIADALKKNQTLIKVGLKFQFNEPESRAAKALIANIDKRRVDRVREEGPGQNVKWKVPKTID
jgi:tropomodulin